MARQIVVGWWLVLNYMRTPPTHYFVEPSGQATYMETRPYTIDHCWHHLSTSPTVIAWKVVGQHLLLDIILRDFMVGTGLRILMWSGHEPAPYYQVESESTQGGLLWGREAMFIVSGARSIGKSEKLINSYFLSRFEPHSIRFIVCHVSGMSWLCRCFLVLRPLYKMMTMIPSRFIKLFLPQAMPKTPHNLSFILHPNTHTRGDHSIVKLNTTCGQNKITFGKLHHQNESNFYQNFFMSRYTWYLLHHRKE